MKGTLKKTKAGWFVWYQKMRDEVVSGYDCLPLYPEDSLLGVFNDAQVEFEITDEFTHQELYKGVGWGDGIKYAKLIVIENTWDEIFNNYPETVNGRYISFKEWLSENYNVPTKK